ncbi:hypothetical protein ABZX64_35335 [Streptomyces misionensis]|uniref:hypothetical protein n=1 Tax=Streptomyces misionensis TaxID=67331 RepID=UPI0033B92448
MLIRETTFTVDLGEHGYLIGFDDDYDFPTEMPFGWRCGPATDATAVVLPTTDTGPLQMTVQMHDNPPDTEPGDAWEPAEEMSLLADTPTLYLATIGQGDFWDAWPGDQPHLEAPAAAGSGGWAACACTATPTTPRRAPATTGKGTWSSSGPPPRHRPCIRTSAKRTGRHEPSTPRTRPSP